MTNSLRLFTSESVTEGHPDKICDQISDSILDALLTVDPQSRVAVETLVTTGLVHVAGEVTTEGYVEIPAIVRKRITEIGYDSSDVWFDGRSCGVSISIGSQSPDIAQGVDDAFETREGTSVDDLDRQGAGDQGIMFGFATRETPSLMPLPIWLAHRLAEQLARVRHEGQVDYLRPDGKTQVTVGYEGTTPRTIETIVVSTQHSPKVTNEVLRAEVEELVLRPVLSQLDLPWEGAAKFINPTGRFEIGGPQGDAGLTGRKIIVDTYGGAARHGGGAFSGKDPSKVDRSAAYAMRWVAKNAVAAGLADRLEVQIAYAIGKAAPGRALRRDLRHRRRCPTRRSSTPSARSSTSVRPPSSATSTCCGRSTRRPPPTVTSVASCRSSPGRRSTASTTCGRPPASSR